MIDGTPTEKRGGAPAGVRRLCADEPSKAITSGSLHEFLHPTEDRALTLREAARLQAFPDGFEFVGSQSERPQMDRWLGAPIEETSQQAGPEASEAALRGRKAHRRDRKIGVGSCYFNSPLS